MRKFIIIDGVPIHVTEEVYCAYHQMGRLEKTQLERDIRNNLLHYNSWSSRYLMASDLVATPEEIVIKKHVTKKLYDCLTLLSKAERDLIHALYFEGESVADLAEKLRIPVRTLGNSRDRILKKLRRMLSVVV